MFAFEIHCSAGTYVRSLILAIAQELGTIATTVCIIRTDSGAFNITKSYTPDQIANREAQLTPVEDVINLPKLEFNKQFAYKLLNGQTLKIDASNGQYLCYLETKLLGVAIVENKRIKIDINLWEETND